MHAAPQRLEGSDIRQILRARRRPLVGEEIGARQERHRHVIDRRRNPSTPRVFELDTPQMRQQVDTVRRASELNDTIVGHETLGRKTDIRKSERREGVHDSIGIQAVSAHEQVEILGESRVAVKGHGMPAGHQEVNVVRDQQREQLAQVLVQHFPGAPGRPAASEAVDRAEPAVAVPAGRRGRLRMPQRARRE